MGNKNNAALTTRQKIRLEQQLSAHEAVLRRFIGQRVKRKSDIEGRVQDTMMAAWQGYAEFKKECCFKSWLCAIAKKQIALFYRSPNNNNDSLPYNDEIGGKEALTEDTCYQHVQLEELHHHIQALPERYQKVIELHAIKGYTHAEVAVMFDISENAAQLLFQKALERLRHRMTKP